MPRGRKPKLVGETTGYHVKITTKCRDMIKMLSITTGMTEGQVIEDAIRKQFDANKVKEWADKI